MLTNPDARSPKAPGVFSLIMTETKNAAEAICLHRAGSPSGPQAGFCNFSRSVEQVAHTNSDLMAAQIVEMYFAPEATGRVGT